jgi:hypothetical protein
VRKRAQRHRIGRGIERHFDRRTGGGIDLRAEHLDLARTYFSRLELALRRRLRQEDQQPSAQRAECGVETNADVGRVGRDGAGRKQQHEEHARGESATHVEPLREAAAESSAVSRRKN